MLPAARGIARAQASPGGAAKLVGRGGRAAKLVGRGGRAAAALALWLAPGCAEPARGPASAPASPSTARAAASPVGPRAAAQHAPERWRRAELRFEIEGQPFPSPLLDAVVGGQPTTLLVDTGASHHVIAQWLTEELSLPLSRAGDVGIDQTGQALRVSRLENTSLSLSGWGRVEEPALLVVQMPDIMRRLGIGGLVAPQLLPAGARAVVLDLRIGELSEAPRDDAIHRVQAAFGAPALAALHACGSPNQGRELTAEAIVEGHAVTLKIDSGATQSSLFAASPAGKALSHRAGGRRSAYVASGKHTVRMLPGARLQLAGIDGPADIDLLPGAPRTLCPTDGFAGMDMLRACVLVLTDDGGLAACAPP